MRSRGFTWQAGIVPAAWPAVTVGAILGGRPRPPHGRWRQGAAMHQRPDTAGAYRRAMRPQVAALVLNANGDPSRFSGYGLPVVADSVAGNPGPLAGVLPPWTGRRRSTRQRMDRDGSLRHAVYTFGPCRAAALGPDCGRTTLSLARSQGRVHPVIGLWPVTLREALRAAVTIGGVRRVGQFASGFICVHVAGGRSRTRFSISIRRQTRLRPLRPALAQAYEAAIAEARAATAASIVVSRAGECGQPAMAYPRRWPRWSGRPDEARGLPIAPQPLRSWGDRPA